MKRHCLTLNLKNDPELIEAYEKHHQQVWPEISKSIKDSGILSMQIFRWETRLFMIMETDDEFSFEKKADLDNSNPKVQEWEKLMWQYQEALPGAKAGEKWQITKLIFNFNG